MKTSPRILGFASDPWVKEYGLWYDTRIGGVPLWPGSLSPTIPLCPVCNSPRFLVLQAYAPSPSHPERTLLLFGCNKITCSADPATWLALRVCNVPRPPSPPAADQTSSPSTPSQVPGSTAEASDVNWDAESTDSDASDLADDLAALSLRVQAQAEQHNKTSRKQKATPNKPSARSGSPSNLVLPHGQPSGSLTAVKDASVVEGKEPPTFGEAFYIQVELESHVKSDTGPEDSVAALLQKYQKEENERASSGAVESWGPEDDDDESSRRTIEEFQAALARAPQQILRYSLAGKPIWPHYPPPDPPSPSACVCGAKFVFELELLGSCLHFLKPDKAVPEHQKEAGMNFAALAIYTCEVDCAKAPVLYQSPPYSAFVQEVCLVQDEW